jgi:uncharacterized protein (TIGR02145 family)
MMYGGPLLMQAKTVLVLTIVATVGLDAVACSAGRAANGRKDSTEIPSSRRMPDGKKWMTQNLAINSDGAYCYAGSDINCGRYGRLYTWEAAQRACASLGSRWRLPTDDDWRALARRYGGVREDSEDSGNAAYNALLIGGSSGFDALLGGDRDDGKFARLEDHGFYWTASETGAMTAVFYNFGQGGLSLNRQSEGSKQMAISVRCISD